jgi:hypothetical protein
MKIFLEQVSVRSSSATDCSMRQQQSLGRITVSSARTLNQTKTLLLVCQMEITMKQPASAAS